MVKFLLPVLCGLALMINSCKVDCEYTCTYSGVPTTGTNKVDSKKCDDCDFPAVNILKSGGYSCSCKEK